MKRTLRFHFETRPPLRRNRWGLFPPQGQPSGGSGSSSPMVFLSCDATGLPAVGANRTGQLSGALSWITSASAIESTQVFCRAGTLSKMTGKLTFSSNAGTTKAVIHPAKGAISGTLTNGNQTITALSADPSGTVYTDASNTDAVAAGDDWCYHVVVTGDGSNNMGITLSMEFT